MCVLVEGHCISDTVALQEMTATPAAKLPYDNQKSLGFHSVKPRKVGDMSTCPEGRAVLHQATDESFVCGQELSCRFEGKVEFITLPLECI